jgi:hypothetical protein
MLVFSVLPDVLWNELVGGARWISRARMTILAVLVAAGLLLPALRPAWEFPAVLLAITIAGLISARLGTAPNPDGVLNWIELSQVRGLLTVQAAKFGVSILTIVALLALGYRRRDAFLTRGQVDSPAAPVRWLGFPTPEPWTSFGAKWVVFLRIGMVIILATSKNIGPAAFHFIPCLQHSNALMRGGSVACAPSGHLQRKPTLMPLFNMHY